VTALSFQWRATAADAIYGQGMAVVPGTAGKGTRWTGMYAQIRADWLVSRNVALALEAVHFEVGDSGDGIVSLSAPKFRSRCWQSQSAAICVL
jgi:hypothetical protein